MKRLQALAATLLLALSTAGQAAFVPQNSLNPGNSPALDAQDEDLSLSCFAVREGVPDILICVDNAQLAALKTASRASENFSAPDGLILLCKCPPHQGFSESDYESASGKLFAGEQFDAGLGHYYLRARYMDPAVGRFTQMDAWEGRPTQPITLNKYLYANADPITGIDPTGEMTLLQTGAVVLGFSALYAIGAQHQPSVVGTDSADALSGPLTEATVSPAVLSLIMLASMVDDDGSSSLRVFTKGNTKAEEKLREGVARRADIINGVVVAYGPKLTRGAAAAIVRAGDDVIARTSNAAREIALIAGGGLTPIGPEIHSPPPGLWPQPHDSAYRMHYHTANRNGAHVFF